MLYFYKKLVIVYKKCSDIIDLHSNIDDIYQINLGGLQ